MSGSRNRSRRYSKIFCPITRLTSGVVVADPGEIGIRSGLRAGDILRGIDGVAVATPTEAAKALERARGRLALKVQRGNRLVSLRFRL